MGSFNAMGTEVTVLAPCSSLDFEAAMTQQVAELFERAEQTFSRFRHDSTLSRINRSNVPTQVSEEVFSILARAEAYTRLTGGAFDPTVGGALIASGYGESFARGALDRDVAPLEHAGPAPGWGALWLDPSARTVARAKGVQLDLGGIVKGYAVDNAARALPCCSAVDAGGDAFMRGDGPDGAGWLVDIEDPRDASRTVMTLRIRDAAVATSAPNRRHWCMGGRSMHHLIDPRTGSPAVTDLAQVTIVAQSAEMADVLAKAVFVLGARAGEAYLAPLRGVAAVLVGIDGEVTRVGRLEVEDE